MIESLLRNFLHLIAIAFPLVIPLFFYNRLFSLCNGSPAMAKELTTKEETVIECTFIVAILLAFTLPPYLQWRLFSAVPSDGSLFSLILSHNPLFTLAGYLVQAFAVAHLIHFLLARLYFGSRFETEIFHAKPRQKYSHGIAYSHKRLVHPRGTVRVMLWLGGLLATLANMTFEGTYLRVDREAVRQNIFWVDRKDYPIPSIQKVILTRRYGRFGRVDWDVTLNLKDGRSRPLFAGLGISTGSAKHLTETLRRVSDERIEFHEIN